MVDTQVNENAESGSNLGWLMDRGFQEAKAVVLHASAVVLSTEIDPEVPWCDYDDYGHDRYVDIDVVEQLAEFFVLTIPFSKEERLENLKLFNSKYKTIIVDRLLANFKNGTLRLLEVFPDGTMSYTQHAGQIDVHWSRIPGFFNKEAI